MRSTKLTLSSVLLILIGLSACSDTDTPNVSGGKSARPYATESAEVAMPANSIYLFKNTDFRGDVTRVENVTAQTPLTPHRLAYGADKISALRWKLPPGVLAVLYEDAEGRGDQVVIWGDGQMPSLAPWKFNDKVSRWSWAYIGGDKQASSQASAGLSERPLDARPTGEVPLGVIEVYRDRDLKGTLTTLGPIANHATGVRHPVGSARDQSSSLRWNLPPGVLVILYEDAGGFGRQLALWGKGQYESIREWDFNDKASRWAWYDISGAQR